jgi:beta-lactamase superfamily II metal-dependent hydrolase
MVMAAEPAPAHVHLRMYRVGFGDCFLLSFDYPAPLPDGRLVRHVLIDFGSTSLAKNQSNLVPIAKQINAHTNGGELDVVVVSHRHRDHLSAFGVQDIPALLAKEGYPKLVVRSWTENPRARSDSRGRRGVAAGDEEGAMGKRSAKFLRTLDRAEEFGKILEERTKTASGRSLAANVHRMALGQLPNEAAVTQLKTWSQDGKGSYVFYGQPSRIEEVVPGIKVHVLGPPTIDQYPAVARQRSRDDDEFWQLYQGLARGLSPADFGLDADADEPFGAAGDSSSEESGAAEPDPAALEAPMTRRKVGEPGPVRWLTDQLSRQQVNSMLRIVRILDDVLNNTSVILLFEVPGARPLKLLFPGDAQIENWEYALKVVKEKDTNLELLRNIDLYKVGHHGSRNATPRTLFNLWNDPTADPPHPMTGVMSTKANVHGDSPATAVPRKTLVAALDTRMCPNFYSTQSLTNKEPFYELVADLSTTTGFQKVAGP